MTESQEACVWSGDYTKSPPAEQELEQFATSVGKPVCFPEWGVVTRSDGHGGGDDPWFMSDFISWMQDPAHNVAWDSYFDFNSGSNSVLTRLTPCHWRCTKRRWDSRPYRARPQHPPGSVQP